MKPISRGSKAGFTLVELIVVIAILAILAGVAIPVYSGYIKKANQAADLQLLGAVNTSFAASCAEVGISSSDVSGAVLKVTDGCITGVTVSGLKPGVTPMFITASIAPTNGVVALSARPSQPFVTLLSATDAKTVISESFLKYFAGNTTTELKYYEGAGNFVFQNGVFVAYDNGADVTFTTAYGPVTISTDILNAYSASTFAGIGTESLTGTIAGLVDSVLSAETSILSSTDLQSFITDTLHMDFNTMSAKQKADALVLLAASGMNGTTLSDLQDRLASGGTLVSGAASSVDGVAQLAAEYALMVAYANTGGNIEIPIFESAVNKTYTKNALLSHFGLNTSNEENYEQAKELLKQELEEAGYYNVSVTGTYPQQVKYYYETEPPIQQNASEYLSGVTFENWDDVVKTYVSFAGSSDFQTYMSGQGATDLNGYYAAMTAINQNVSSLEPDALSSLLESGYTDQEFNAMLAAMFGG